MIYNGVQNHMMTKSPAITITNGEITWEYKKSAQTILNTKYNAKVYTAVVLSNEYAGVAGTSKTGEFKVRAFLADDEAITSTTMTVKGTVDLDLLGKSVKIIIADTKTGGVYNTVYGEPMLADINNIYTVSSNKKQTKAASFKEEVESEGVDSTTIHAGESATPVYLNYVARDRKSVV